MAYQKCGSGAGIKCSYLIQSQQPNTLSRPNSNPNSNKTYIRRHTLPWHSGDFSNMIGELDDIQVFLFIFLGEIIPLWLYKIILCMLMWFFGVLSNYSYWNVLSMREGTLPLLFKAASPCILIDIQHTYIILDKYLLNEEWRNSCHKSTSLK